MAWFGLGALLLLLAVRGAGGKRARPDSIGLAAIAAFAAAAWWGPSVYPAARIVPVVLAWAAALALMLWLAPSRAAPTWARLALLVLGAAASLFALLGPADGLF